jgi:hypothetical protein
MQMLALSPEPSFTAAKPMRVISWWDQGGGAFGSAAVPRPVGSSLMPLRQTHHHPDLAIYLASRAPTISAAAIQQKKRPTEHED